MCRQIDKDMRTWVTIVPAQEFHWCATYINKHCKTHTIVTTQSDISFSALRFCTRNSIFTRFGIQKIPQIFSPASLFSSLLFSRSIFSFSTFSFCSLFLSASRSLSTCSSWARRTFSCFSLFFLSACSCSNLRASFSLLSFSACSLRNASLFALSSCSLAALLNSSAVFSWKKSRRCVMCKLSLVGYTLR